METTEPVEDRSGCWCCGGSFAEDDLVRLGSHPEVGLCFDCTRWAHRRAVARLDESRHGVAVRGRAVLRTVRGWVMARGVQDWPLIGAVLRRLDRRLP